MVGVGGREESGREERVGRRREWEGGKSESGEEERVGRRREWEGGESESGEEERVGRRREWRGESGEENGREGMSVETLEYFLKTFLARVREDTVLVKVCIGYTHIEANAHFKSSATLVA